MFILKLGIFEFGFFVFNLRRRRIRIKQALFLLVKKFLGIRAYI